MKEIEQEAFGDHGMATQDPKQTAAVDLSNRLKDLRAGNDGSSQKGFLPPTAQSFTSCRFWGKHNWINLFIFCSMCEDLINMVHLSEQIIDNLSPFAFIHG